MRKQRAFLSPWAVQAGRVVEEKRRWKETTDWA